MDQDKDILTSEGKRGEEKNLNNTKAITHHLHKQTYARTVSEQDYLPVLLRNVTLYSMEYPCGQLGSAVLGWLCTIPASCAPLAYLLGWQSEK